ncbi:FprA family A-type flavoprotein [Falsiporphyromonas endometrii]|uniref:FprA family A-type flavoprotein n=1 Tax=Falsiporphyromonas endometrii TaxID=1387297 RepID=A0ABV9K7V2_9PORP
MFEIPQITEGIYYVGVNDRAKAKFENVWPLYKGVSYNSYLIVDEKVVLIDTVDVCYSDIFFYKIDLILKGRPIDYLVVDHMEPDHSGSIGLLKQKYPDIKIIGNKKTFNMLNGYHGITENLVEVEEGMSIKIGKRELSFIMAPMVHWPEVMFTYEQHDKVLFSADAFGTFGALDGHILDKDMDIDKYWYEMERYYACIVGKFGPFVQKVFKKLQDNPIEIDYVCSTHGPVWTKAHFSEAMAVYDRLSKYEAYEGACIIFGSMYGHTEILADTIAQAIAKKGIKNVVVHSLTSSDPSDILRDVFRYKAIVLGAPTYCNNLFSPMEHIIHLIELREVKNRYLSLFGSCTWAIQSIKKMTALTEKLAWEKIGEPVEMKMAPTPEVLNKAAELGEQIAQKLIEDRK